MPVGASDAAICLLAAKFTLLGNLQDYLAPCVSCFVEFMGAPGVYGVRPESHGEILAAAAALVD